MLESRMGQIEAGNPLAEENDAEDGGNGDIGEKMDRQPPAAPPDPLHRRQAHELPIGHDTKQGDDHYIEGEEPHQKMRVHAKTSGSTV